MSTPRARLGLLGLLALGLLSCGPRQASLTGSLSQYFPLDFTRHEVLRTNNAFQVTYFKDGADRIDVVARVTVVTTGLDWKPGKSFDLSGEYAPGHPRAVVSHAAGNEPPRQLPPIKRGTLTLDSGGAAGQDTSGTFDLAFGEGGDFGDGRTLTGDYVTKAVDTE